MLLFYFGLVLVLTLPVWIVSWNLHLTLLPGLPIAAVAVIVPASAAIVVTAFAEGRPGLYRLLSPLWKRWRGSPAGWLLALGGPWLTTLPAWLAHQATPGVPSAIALLAMSLVFVLAGAAEEIGWTGFAIERLTRTRSELQSGLLVGVVWALWHYPALLELGRSAPWIAGWTVWTVAQRLIMTRIYLRSGRWLWGPILFHAMSNLTWQLAPASFDPLLEAIAMVVLATLAILLWRAKS